MKSGALACTAHTASQTVPIALNVQKASIHVPISVEGEQLLALFAAVYAASTMVLLQASLLQVPPHSQQQCCLVQRCLRDTSVKMTDAMH